MRHFERATLEQFAAVVGARLGLYFDDSKFDLLAEVRRRRREACGRMRPDAYLARLEANGARGTARLLSAGCASGDEAYSLAIGLRNVSPFLPARPSWGSTSTRPGRLRRGRAATGPGLCATRARKSASATGARDYV